MVKIKKGMKKGRVVPIKTDVWGEFKDAAGNPLYKSSVYQKAMQDYIGYTGVLVIGRGRRMTRRFEKEWLKSKKQQPWAGLIKPM